jgi:hypothetical protein
MKIQTVVEYQSKSEISDSPHRRLEIQGQFQHFMVLKIYFKQYYQSVVPYFHMGNGTWQYDIIREMHILRNAFHGTTHCSLITVWL